MSAALKRLKITLLLNPELEQHLEIGDQAINW